jgi:hypothetical protein
MYLSQFTAAKNCSNLSTYSKQAAFLRSWLFMIGVITAPRLKPAALFKFRNWLANLLQSQLALRNTLQRLPIQIFSNSILGVHKFEKKKTGAMSKFQGPER